MAWTDWKKFNFRTSQTYVTDNAGDGQQGVWSIPSGSIVYPQTRTISGDSVTYGLNNFSSMIDRSTSGDVRLAGSAQTANTAGNQRWFRVDLPSPGTYEIDLAMGDVPQGQRQYWQVVDDTTVLETVDLTGTFHASNSFYDATGVLRSAADWPSQKATKQYTFATTTCFLRFGGNGVSASTNNSSTMAHIAIRQVSAGGGGPADPLIVWSSHRRVFVNDIVTQQ